MTRASKNLLTRTFNQNKGNPVILLNPVEDWQKVRYGKNYFPKGKSKLYEVQTKGIEISSNNYNKIMSGLSENQLPETVELKTRRGKVLVIKLLGDK